MSIATNSRTRGRAKAKLTTDMAASFACSRSGRDLDCDLPVTAGSIPKLVTSTDLAWRLPDPGPGQKPQIGPPVVRAGGGRPAGDRPRATPLRMAPSLPPGAMSLVGGPRASAFSRSTTTSGGPSPLLQQAISVPSRGRHPHHARLAGAGHVSAPPAPRRRPGFGSGLSPASSAAHARRPSRRIGSPTYPATFGREMSAVESAHNRSTRRGFLPYTSGPSGILWADPRAWSKCQLAAFVSYARSCRFGGG
jgi:hypothetical protein